MDIAKKKSATECRCTNVHCMLHSEIKMNDTQTISPQCLRNFVPAVQCQPYRASLVVVSDISKLGSLDVVGSSGS